MSWNFFDSWKSKRSSEKPIKCTEKEMADQESKCKKIYSVWQECVDTCGFNDPVCREKHLDKYYKCVTIQNRMKTFLQDQDLHK